MLQSKLTFLCMAAKWIALIVREMNFHSLNSLSRSYPPEVSQLSHMLTKWTGVIYRVLLIVRKTDLLSVAREDSPRSQGHRLIFSMPSLISIDLDAKKVSPSWTPHGRFMVMQVLICLFIAIKTIWFELLAYWHRSVCSLPTLAQSTTESLLRGWCSGRRRSGLVFCTVHFSSGV